MEKIGDILIKIITFPFTVIKWIFYTLLVYLFVFGLGAALDRYEKMPSSLAPLYKSIVRINHVLLIKITPHFESVATKLEKSEQLTPSTEDTSKKETQPEVDKVKELEDNYTFMQENTEKQIKGIEKALKTVYTSFEKSMEGMYKNLDKQQKNNAFYSKSSLFLACFASLISIVIGAIFVYNIP